MEWYEVNYRPLESKWTVTMPRNVPTLNGRQRAFVKHYMGRDPELHGHITRSYKAAYGLTDTASAATAGSRLIRNPLIKALIAKATARLDEKLVTDAGFVLDQSRRLYDRAMGDAPIPGETLITTDPNTGDEIVTVTQRHEYDPATARQALQLIGQHKAVQAFSVTVEHSHTHRLEQRLAARSKLIEGKAGAVDPDPILAAPGKPGSTPSPAAAGPGLPVNDDRAPVDTSPHKRIKKVPSGGGQNERAPIEQGNALSHAGATAK